MADDLKPALQTQAQVGEDIPQNTRETRLSSTTDKVLGATGIKQFGKAVDKVLGLGEQQEEPARPAPVVNGKEYTPPALRRQATPTLGEEVPYGLPSFLGGAVDEASQTGFASNISRVAEDLAFEDGDDNSHLVAKALPSLMEKHGIPEQFGDVIMEQARTPEHAEILAKRVQRVVKHTKQMDNMGTIRQLATGVTGFALDPANLVPGVAVLKGAGATAKLVRNMAPRFSMLQKTKLGKLGAWTSFGAIEEAVRNSPRLANDPTYQYEQYLLDVGIGAGFGGGLAAGMMYGKQWVTTPFNKVAQAIRGSYDKVAENATIRTGVNMAADAAKASGRAAKNDGLIKVLKEADVGAAVRSARDKARKQADESVTVRKVREAGQAAAEKIKAGEGETLKSFSESMQEILDATLPKGSALRTKLDDFNRWVDERAAKEAVQSVGAAKRKESVATKAGDVAADIKSELDGIKKSVKDQVDDINVTKQAALDAIGDATDNVSTKARMAIEASAIAAVRAVEEAAARNGHKVVRSVLDRAELDAKIQKRFTDTLGGQKKKIETAEMSFAARGVHIKGDLAIALREAMDDLGIRITGVDGTTGDIVKWIKEGGDASLARDRIIRAYDDVIEKAEDLYIGHPSDGQFMEAQRALRELKDEAESLTDWAGMMQSKEYSDLTKIDPRWALLSEEYETAMGANREVLQEQYEKLQQRFISKQFGTLTESLSAKLVRSKVPLAEWMALNILELPAGTGGKIARNETAAIISQMMEADIVVPMNKAWFDLMDAHAKEVGMGRFKRAILRTAGGNTHPAVQQVSREVMKYVNAKQMGREYDAPAHVVEFARKLEQANNKLYDIQLQHNLEGITGANKMKNYMKQSWNDGAILDAFNNPNIGREGTIELLSKSLKSRAGERLSSEHTRDLAEAILDTKLAAMHKPQVDAFRLRSDNLTRSMGTIEDIIQKLNDNRKTSSIDAILKWAKDGDGGGPSYVHKRFLDLDYNTTITKNGETISILDLLDNDVIGNLNRYSKEATGRAAISKASGGRLNSEASINDFIGAVGMQAADMGTYVNTGDIRNVFRQMMGLPYDGQLPISVRKIRDAVSLAGMNGLGESQLAEFGLAANRGLSGLFAMQQLAKKTVGKVKQWRAMELTPEQKADTAFLNELQEFSKLYEDMHIVARNNVHFDMREPTMATSAVQKMVDTGTGGKFRPTLQYLQTRYTGYGAVRTMEEQVAMAGLMHDAMKFVRQATPDLDNAKAVNIGKNRVVFEAVEKLDGKLATTNRKTGKITLRKGITKEEVLTHVRGGIVSPATKHRGPIRTPGAKSYASQQKQVLNAIDPTLATRLEQMSLNDIKKFLIAHEHAHTQQNLATYYDDAAQTIAEKAGLGNSKNKFLSDSAIRMEQEANEFAFKAVAEGQATPKAFTSEARFKDIGLDLDLLRKKLDDGVIELGADGNIKTLNMHRWSQAEQQTLGVALRRHAAQQVQMGFAGEMSPLMTNPMVAMMMQFRSYPMLAAEKQMGRNAQFADKEAGMGIALNAASSAAARIIRYHSLASALPEDKREQYIEKKMANDFGHDSLQYMGIVGMMVNNYDTAMALGGNGSIADQFPVISWADNYIKGAKSVNPVGGYDERDIANMQRGAPIGTIMYVNALSGVIRNLMDTDADASYKYRKTRGS